MNKIKLFLGSSVAVVVIGCAMIAVSLPMPVYKDEAAYYTARTEIEDRYASFNDNGTGPLTGRQEAKPHDLTREWRDLRDASLTAKYPLFDHGLDTALLGASMAIGTGVFILFSPRPRRRLRSPSKATFYVLANLGVIAIAAGSAASILVDYDRGAFPYWSDTLAIPLVGIAVLTVLIIPFLNVSALLLGLGYKKGRTLNFGGSRNLIVRILRFLPLALTVVLAGFSIAGGDYSNIASLVFWGFMFGIRAFYPRPRTNP